MLLEYIYGKELAVLKNGIYPGLSETLQGEELESLVAFQPGYSLCCAILLAFHLGFRALHVLQVKCYLHITMDQIFALKNTVAMMVGVCSKQGTDLLQRDMVQISKIVY